MDCRRLLVGILLPGLIVGSGIILPARAQFIGGGLEFHPQEAPSTDPINAHATHEARQLLAYLYSTYGKVMLSGEHNQLAHMSKPSDKVQEITGKYPLIWGGDWGFSDERHDVDNIKYRPKLLDEIRAQYASGRVIVLTYHQACPTVGEPCDFRGGVQRKISDSEWEAILTEGTRLHQVWQDCVDRLADAIGTLQEEKIPIIFRPYHEMNGDWFWWGGDPARFKSLWAMIYNRFVNVHHLNNILWAWTPDKPYAGVEAFFPGTQRVDLLGTDIYPAADRKEVYPQEWFDRMHDLAGTKPLALSEMSVLPNPEDFKREPWAWFMGWDALMFSANTPDKMREVFNNPIVLTDHH